MIDSESAPRFLVKPSDGSVEIAMIDKKGLASGVEIALKLLDYESTEAGWVQKPSTANAA